ncbi:WXG100 family type VII secretion target [Kitasatospora sp. NPDC051170]|uniref:WXG100 family type VII secretion target n=1 Tax=Kitasatospora sp. NPDC051170 TaxID=3364056 RepID=UPI003791B717
MSDGTTNFADKTHQQLIAMVTSTQPSLVLSRSQQLQAAGRVLGELSAALKSHLGNVNWEGQAGENFKTWAGNLQQSAEKLGAYAANAGTAMHQAGEMLSSVKAGMPEFPRDAQRQVLRRGTQQPLPSVVNGILLFSTNPNDPGNPNTAQIDDAMKGKLALDGNPWVTDAMFKASESQVYRAHQDAIHQMEKLGQAYSAATTTLTGLGDNVVLPGTPGEGNKQYSSSDYPNGGGYGGGSGGYVSRPRRGSSSTGGSYQASTANYAGSSVSYREPGTGSWESTSGRAGSIPPHGGGQAPLPQDPGSVGSPSSPSSPIDPTGTGIDSLPPSSTLPNPTIPGSGPLTPDGPGSTPIYQGGGLNSPGGGPGIPGGYPTGAQGPGFPVGGGPGAVPVKGGGSGSTRPVPFGGAKGPGSPGAPALPVGKVFGLNEAGPAGGNRGGMPMGGMHPMGGHGAGGGGGGSRGRGLTSTPGGVVGGRKGPAASGEFTPGGTGLRNRAGAGAAEGGARGQNGMMAPGMAGHGGRNERDRRKRADYLHEDEETWTSGTPYSNPDVIE